MVPTHILDEAENYLADIGFELLVSDGRRMANALEGLRPEPDHSDADRYEIVIELVQRAARNNTPKIVTHGDVGSVTHIGDVNGSIWL